MDQLLTEWPALLPKLEALGLRLLGAVVLATLSWLLIRFVVRLTGAALERAHVEPTIAGFLTRLLRVTLTVFLVVVMLGVVGLQLAAFAAAMAGVGIAIGGAMSGLLGDFAAGLLLLVLRPFDVGDEIAIEGTEGQVEEIGVFRTVLVRDDHVHTTIGNSKLLGDVLERRSAKASVRVRLRLALQPDADAGAIVAALTGQMAALAGVLATPPPRVRMVDFGTGIPVIEMRAYCDITDKDALTFAVNRLAATLPRAPAEPARVRIAMLMQ
jgi:small conductance mechanosensitive channel